MPWADYFAAFDYSLAEGASAMEAGVLHGGDFTVHVGDADELVSAGDFFGFVKRGEFGFGGDLSEHGLAVIRQEPNPLWSLPNAESQIPRFARDDKSI